LEEFEGYVQEAVDVPLKQNEFDALVAWTYNLGPGNLRSSTMLKRLNDSCFDEVPSEMRRWNKAGGKVVNGLVRRREAEALLFKNEDWGHV
jgi:lysozyme